MHRAASLSLALLLGLLLAACGNVVVTPPGSDDMGGGDGQGETPPAAEYSVQYSPGPDHLVVLKADHELDRCVQLHAITPPEVRPGLDIETPEGWSANYVKITDRAADCEDAGGTSRGATLTAGAAGTLSWEPGPSTWVLCNLSVDVMVMSSEEPEAHHLLATGLSIGGDCP
ncbi:hypothetical protein WMF04_28020 [Sorangium sp. So ce260]|uniref:hypothetical protein n=1 Tax=Sorangium sp. So ce260 TaxID=3133291 RepID=UPI003F6150EC